MTATRRKPLDGGATPDGSDDRGFDETAAQQAAAALAAWDPWQGSSLAPRAAGPAGPVLGGLSEGESGGGKPASAGATAGSAPVRAGVEVAPGTILPTDPLLAQQWHLGNSVAGLLDLNVRGVWNPTSGAAYTGAGTRVVVIDDGFDYNHSDLSPNYNQSLDYDFEFNNTNPFGTSSQAHGTAVAGIIGADNNGTGAVGVAFDTQLVGYRTANFITDAWLQDVRDAIANAATSAFADVANISQGIANDVNSEFGVGYAAARFDEIETAIGTAVEQGRGGLGMTIVKSAGNSRGASFDVNADDWTNDTRQVVVAAVDQNGFVSSYSSYGAANLISGFGTPGQVVTTDRVGAAGYSNTDFTSSFNGTSSAAPMVSGVVSLMYDAEAGLGWRDVQTILAYSARQVGSAVGAAPTGAELFAWGWNGATTWNSGGLHYSNDYGYGLVDGLAAVRLAESWLRPGTVAQTSGNEFTNTMDMLNVATVIPDGNTTGLTFTGNAGFADRVERVTVQMTFSTTFTGDLEVYLTSPTGTVSRLIADTGGSNDFNGTWTFESQAFRGELANGTWSVRVVDDTAADALTVSDIVVKTWGAASSNDRYIFTNEYNRFAGVGGHNQVITDAGGVDEINAAAVSTASFINLTAGSTSTIAGKSLTIAAGTAIENAHGGDGGDTIYGNTGSNSLFGYRGNDVLFGNSGNDFLYGDDGSDILIGGVGADALNGGAGSDYAFYGNSGGVAVNLNTGGAAGGEAEGDTFSGIESVIGSAFADTLTGDALGNELIGNGGDDTFEGLAGGDVIVGGDGFDTVLYLSSPDTVAINLTNLSGAGGHGAGDVIVSVENVTGSAFGDLIRGDGLANLLFGASGGDLMFGEGGGDILVGGAGDDVMNGGAGADFFFFRNDAGSDIVTDFDQNGDDQIIFSGFGAGFASTLQTAIVNGSDVFLYSGAWAGSVVFRNAAGLVDSGDFIFV